MPKTAIKERGITMPGVLIPPLLAGNKTQHRVLIKPQPPEDWSPLGVGLYCPTVVGRDGEERPGKEIFGAYSEDWAVACPYGGPGDRLWVREAWQFKNWTDAECAKAGFHDAAKHPTYNTAIGDPGAWKPSIHMPRWASRITLELTAVRAQRVQEISEGDAQYEGCERPILAPGMDLGNGLRGHPMTGYYRDAFATLWDSLHGVGAWELNKWVFALSFRVLETGA